MQRIEYTVTATLPDSGVASEYLDWLRHGHVRDVLQAGAEDAAIMHVLDPQHPIRVVTRYTFPSRDAFETYERDHAPALRADGLRRFGTGSGVSFERRVSAIEPISPVGA